MGFPVRPPIETHKKNVPDRTPMSRIGDICAINAGPSETNAPVENPYNTQNMMMATIPLPGIHNARTMMAEKQVVIIMTLKRPNRSAMIPGMIRPKTEAALRMGMRYIVRLREIPSFLALVEMSVDGTAWKNEARTVE